MTKTADAPAYSVCVFIAGDRSKARDIAQAYVNEVGLCVTVTPTEYVYTGGLEQGAAVGLVNYPRFPSDPTTIWSHAEALAHRLISGLGQETALIQSSDLARWLTRRKVDNDG